MLVVTSIVLLLLEFVLSGPGCIVWTSFDTPNQDVRFARELKLVSATLAKILNWVIYRKIYIS